MTNRDDCVGPREKTGDFPDERLWRVDLADPRHSLHYEPTNKIKSPFEESPPLFLSRVVTVCEIFTLFFY